ncbi:hypothetical protein C8R43DRAFT_441400 [Mycena crocata]|nr:hypothetical protein C8R43DRAFT_441400 [Mycena crocata]
MEKATADIPRSTLGLGRTRIPSNFFCFSLASFLLIPLYSKVLHPVRRYILRRRSGFAARVCFALTLPIDLLMQIPLQVLKSHPSAIIRTSGTDNSFDSGQGHVPITTTSIFVYLFSSPTRIWSGYGSVARGVHDATLSATRQWTLGVTYHGGQQIFSVDHNRTTATYTKQLV